MSPDQLVSVFDRIADAPGAVERLRRFVLDLAVRGRLVEQNEREESGEELLKKIRQEKNGLVSKGKIKKIKPLNPVSFGEMPYFLPSSWKWVRVGDLAIKHLGGGNSLKGKSKLLGW